MLTDTPTAAPRAPLDERPTDLNLPLAAIGLVAGTFSAFFSSVGAPISVWAAFLLWFVLAMIAAMAQSAPRSRAYVTGTLRKRQFTQIHAGIVGGVLDRVWTRYAREVAPDASRLAHFRAVWTWKLIDDAFLVATIYPFLLIDLWWTATGRAPLITPELYDWSTRATTALLYATLALLGCAALVPQVRRVLSPTRFLALFILVFAASVLLDSSVSWVALAIVTALWFHITFGARLRCRGIATMLVMSAVTADFFFTSSILASLAPLALATLFIALICWCDARDRLPLALLSVLTFYIVLVGLGVARPEFQGRSATQEQTFMFLGLFPPINGLFDAISYAVTLALARIGFRSQPIAYGALDLAIACCLFFCLSASLIWVTDTLRSLSSGEPRIHVLFWAFQDAPHAFWAIYLMIFSTIVPTALHFAVSLFGAQGILPLRLRRAAAGLMRGAPDQSWKAMTAPILIGALWALPLLLLGVGLALLSSALYQILATYADILMTGLFMLNVPPGALP